MRELYNSFLEWSGLSHLNVVVIFAVLFLIFGFFLSAQQFGIFSSVSFSEKTFEGKKILSINHQGAYNNLSIVMEKIKKDLEQHFKIS